MSVPSLENSLHGLLAGSGADFDDSGWFTPGSGEADSAAEDSMTVLSHYALLAVEGPDAEKFLQGQTTNDWQAVTPAQASYGAACDPKGRMYCSYLAAATSEQCRLLRLRVDLLESTRDTLAKYIVFSKADLQDRRSTWSGLGFSGETAAGLLRDRYGALPGDDYGSLPIEQGLLIKLPGQTPRFELWAEATHCQTLYQEAATQLPVTGGAHWELLAIRAGQADICAATVGEFIPQMLNLEITGGVSFTKGCYTGQEVVARMQYRGKLKRRMYRFQADRPSGPGTLAGTPLHAEAEQSIGHVVTNAGEEVLAVVTRDACEAGGIAVRPDGPALQPMDLPYPLPDA